MDHLKPTTYTVRYPRWMVGRPLLAASSALASLGDAMFGYSQGVIAANQVQPAFIKRMFKKVVTLDQIQAGHSGVNPTVLAITVACLNITAAISAMGAAYVCDILGRRMSVRIGAVIYFFASFIQMFAPNLATLIVGRCIQGVAVGMLSMTVPVLQCEIAPGHARGVFVSIEYLCLNGGYVLSAWVGYGFFFAMPSEIAWRGPYIIQAVMAFILILWTFVLPETPRWLIKNGFKEEGLCALADLTGHGDPMEPEIQKSYAEIVAAIAYEDTFGQASWAQLFKQYTRRSVVGITCQMFAQLNGINAILYFLPTNLTRAGFTVSKALLYSGACALIYCAGTVPTMFYIDKWGRRFFLLFGSAALVASLAAIGGLQFYSDSLPEGPVRMPAANGIFTAVCIYLFFFGATWGPTPWLLGAEIFPLRARAKGMALSTISNWIFNFIIAFITPPLFSAIHGGYYFLLLGFCAISGVFVYFVYPETAHLTLEELGEAFGDKVMDDGKLLTPVVPPNALGHPEEPQDVKAVIEQVEKAQEDIRTVGGSTANINH
ncbi:major facilitator superfamily [Heterobasidion irregulare TC 32-1]|uniref:Major facilitator superfamily n=1 Tax=Heterobasidion irregulare (strain TC 32-1) TaxID=747525 RepID=W4KG26_HETIT|nr:major facilitator superfamily [Heterobasidion irregulare TC 32-1]ETW84265.1 major facilitator superfamily [Heterobasidion irregulare TC 32-1]